MLADEWRKVKDAYAQKYGYAELDEAEADERAAQNAWNAAQRARSPSIAEAITDGLNSVNRQNQRAQADIQRDLNRRLAQTDRQQQGSAGNASSSNGPPAAASASSNSAASSAAAAPAASSGPVQASATSGSNEAEEYMYCYLDYHAGGKTYISQPAAFPGAMRSLNQYGSRDEFRQFVKSTYHPTVEDRLLRTQCDGYATRQQLDVGVANRRRGNQFPIIQTSWTPSLSDGS